VAGCIVDFSLGVFLQARIEALENTPQRTVFTADLNPAYGRFQPGSPTPDGLSETAWANWYFKHRFALCRQLLDMVAAYPVANVAAQQAASLARAGLRRYQNEDAVYWQGWWGRHDYALAYLGDDVAGESGEGAGVPQAALVILFLALTGALLREMLHRPPRRVPQRARARGSRR